MTVVRMGVCVVRAREGETEERARRGYFIGPLMPLAEGGGGRRCALRAQRVPWRRPSAERGPDVGGVVWRRAFYVWG